MLKAAGLATRCFICASARGGPARGAPCCRRAPTPRA
jgi:hypothetical protein